MSSASRRNRVGIFLIWRFPSACAAVRRWPRCRTGPATLMRGGWVPSPASDYPQWMAQRPRPDSNRRDWFCRPAPDHSDTRSWRAPGWDRTSDPQVRNLVLCPLSYEGKVGAEGFEPPRRLLSRRIYSPVGQPNAQHTLGVTAGGRTRTARATISRAQPVHHGHRTRGGARTPGLLLVRQALHLLSYTGILRDVRRARIEPRPAGGTRTLMHQLPFQHVISVRGYDRSHDARGRQ